ncbi:MAG: SLC13 family permease, partial [Porticoccaceae bacterium]|nr:SLC13 family permease [Porticoccaceae bacterium]
MARMIGFALGIGVLLLTLLTPPPEGMSESAWITAGVGLLMACWWATEAIPVPMTSLLPIVLFPLLGLASLKGATAPYAHPVIYLLMGGFIIATALQRWNLHRRLALTILRQVGNHPYAIIGGFMGISAFLSMWISNTATTIMMIPIALSMASVLIGGDKKEDNFTICLILGIAYSASIGGLGTLVGTPPNAMVAAYMSETYNVEIGFLQWMLLGIPVVLVLVPLAWWLLTRVAFTFQMQHNDSV